MEPGRHTEENPSQSAGAQSRTSSGTSLRAFTMERGSMAGKQRLNVLVVDRDRPGEPDETQLRTIQTVGAQIALFAENVRRSP